MYANRWDVLPVEDDMNRHISELHVPEPGLAVVDITGADEPTVRAVEKLLAAMWAAAGHGPQVWRESGEPGVRLRMYLDIRCSAAADRLEGEGEPEEWAAARPLEAVLAELPSDTRPMPSLEPYDQLLRRPPS
jgi:hypothetical protein